ncbi:alpha/beta fold hydrolase [Actinoallomurus iriomotensis]|uniref:Alpha/beta hydrolase n=1 Tax=Actinoallomurus iriomotensis TaxID=478107 RepID=A0A9W6VT08_9ACTN|nr:alpha/beta hydrolase [Actinoallomurus iriomotensis]GLY77136.1 alpha/beta hydrolase [Actinoallomurus iriomotensis]
MTRLHVREWGEGDRVAVLVHGLSGDSSGWLQVAPELARRGYRVLAPDLTGHGQSPRGEYSRERWADDLLETLPARPDLAIGHSLGGVLLAMIVDRLHPARAVYEDPAWYPAEGGYGAGMPAIADAKNWTIDDLKRAFPHWSAQAHEARLAAFERWDPATTHMRYVETAYVPVIPSVPSLVLLADPSALIPPHRAEEFTAAGFELRTVPGTSHNIHNDDLDGFLAALDGWL